MTDQEYHGYTNKETWRTMLLINEVGGLFTSGIKRIIESLRSEPGITNYEIRTALSRSIRERIEHETCLEFDGSFVGDLTKYAFNRIDFDQIATILIEESKNA